MYQNFYKRVIQNHYFGKMRINYCTSQKQKFFIIIIFITNFKRKIILNTIKHYYKHLNIIIFFYNFDSLFKIISIGYGINKNIIFS